LVIGHANTLHRKQEDIHIPKVDGGNLITTREFRSARAKGWELI